MNIDSLPSIGGGPTRAPRPAAATRYAPPQSLYPTDIHSRPAPTDILGITRTVAAPAPAVSQQPSAAVENLIDKLRRDLDAAEARAAQDASTIARLEQRAAAAEQRARAAADRLAHSDSALFATRMQTAQTTIDDLQAALNAKARELDETVAEWAAERSANAAQANGRAAPGVVNTSFTPSELDEARETIKWFTHKVDDLESTIETLNMQLKTTSSTAAAYHQRIVELTQRENPGDFQELVDDDLAKFDLSNVDLLDFAEIPEMQAPPNSPEEAVVTATLPSTGTRKVILSSGGSVKRAKPFSDVAASTCSDADFAKVTETIEGRSEADLTRSLKVEELTELLRLLGKQYVRPKSEAVRVLLQTVQSRAKSAEAADEHAVL